MGTPSSIVSSIYSSGKIYDRLFAGSSGYLYWGSLAQAYGDPVLEIMCGTGLVSIPLARQGYKVTGLDLAKTMLAEARHKASQAGVEVDWVLGDVRDFDLGKQFKLIFLPSNSICHLLTRADLEACLACVAHHLDASGRFAVTVFVPSLELLIKTSEEEQPFSTYTDPESGEEVVMTQRSWYDSATQIKHNQLFKRVGSGPTEPNGELTMRMYFPQELDALFWYNGFAIEHKYGGTDHSPFDGQSAMQYYILKHR
ncbi:MAG: class I SAM-dependent methyltransferase [Caldilineaceae bacterium]|nr:class I SAM-dependent methyltransferase [Caldilineaceae bacterium]